MTLDTQWSLVMVTRKNLLIMLAVLGLSWQSLSACTIFMITDGNVVLVGNNEDWLDPNGQVHFIPPSDGKHGIVYFGHSNGYAQGGMNDRGLFFDHAATRPLEVTQGAHKPSTNVFQLMNKVMRECSTVDEALDLFDSYNLSFMAKHQTLICDRNGDSVIIEGDEIIRKTGNFQAVTNFYQSKTRSTGFWGEVSNLFGSGSHPTSVRCKRYKTALKMLSEMVEPSVEGVRDILNAVHQ
ncbi:MAG: C45 family peptidase [Planctomycetota bacterium]